MAAGIVQPGGDRDGALMATRVHVFGAGALALVLAGGAAVGLDSPSRAYNCSSISVPLEVLEEGRPAADLDASQLAGLREVTEGLTMQIGDLSEWKIVTASKDRLVILGPPQDDLAASDGSPVNSVVAADRGDGGWQLDVAGACDLRLDLGGLGNADVRLDPQASPSGDVTELHLLVTERACASGEPADGRIRAVSEHYTDDELQIAIGVETRPGDQACPGNPETPFTLHLKEPLGERAVVDSTAYPRVRLEQ